MTQEEVIGLEGIRGKKKAADRDGDEVVRFFEGGWSSVAAFGRTSANEETGDVVFDELVVEVDEQVAEALVGATLLA